MARVATASTIRVVSDAIMVFAMVALGQLKRLVSVSGGLGEGRGRGLVTVL